jgi:hypothetical protein
MASGMSSHAAAYFLGAKCRVRKVLFFIYFQHVGGKTFFLIFVQHLLLHVCVVGVAATAERTDREKERKVVV